MSTKEKVMGMVEIIDKLTCYLQKFTGADFDENQCYSGTTYEDYPLWCIDASQNEGSISETIESAFRKKLQNNKQLELVDFQVRYPSTPYTNYYHQYMLLLFDNVAQDYYSFGFDIIWSNNIEYKIDYYFDRLNKKDIESLAARQICDLYEKSNFVKFADSNTSHFKSIRAANSFKKESNYSMN